MPNPTICHPESQNIRHFLGIAEIYLYLGQPSVFEVEPQVNANYRPDAYVRCEEPMIVEYQRSKITIKKMQEKIDLFAKSCQNGEHDAKTLWVVSDITYNVTTPKGFQLIQSSLKTKEKGAVS